jgi:DNA polymerase III epsilon subunit-like protein
MDNDGLKFCILDTETNGLNTKTSNVIEIAWVITDKYLNVLKQESFLIKGDFVISDFITNLTGITKQKTISDGVLIDTALKKLYDDIIQCQFIVAHNIIFDYNMILNEINNIFKNKPKYELDHYVNVFKSKTRLCSLHILKKECLDRCLPITNHKLQTLHNYLVENSEIQSHRAMSDVYMILECFQILDEFDILKYFWNKSLSFGKCKGKTNEWIYENDKDYFNWLLCNIYNINTIYKKDQILYQDEEYEYDGFVVSDNTIECDSNTGEDTSNTVNYTPISTPATVTVSHTPVTLSHAPATVSYTHIYTPVNYGEVGDLSNINTLPRAPPPSPVNYNEVNESESGSDYITETESDSETDSDLNSGSDSDLDSYRICIHKRKRND